jgi:hypothetical protein
MNRDTCESPRSMEKDVLTETAIEALKLSLRGELLMPHCAGYRLGIDEDNRQGAA